MCDPTALLVAGTVLSGAGAVVGAEADIQTLKFKSKVAENNERLANIQAKGEEARGAAAADQVLRDTSRTLSEQVVSTAGAGVAVEGGSAQEIFDTTKRAGAADFLATERNTAKTVWGIRTQAAGFKAEAKRLKRAARQRRLFQPIEAVAPLVKGFGQVGILEAGK